MASLWNAVRGRNIHNAHVHAFEAVVPGTARILPILSVCTETGPDSPDHTTGIWASHKKAQPIAEKLALQIAKHRRAFVCATELDGLEIQVSPHHQLIVFNDLGTATA